MSTKIFDKIIYKCPFMSAGTRYIKELIGIDSETLISGKPFLICMSDGTSYNLGEFPDVFFRHAYRGKNFVAYNLKFDSGSLLYSLPAKVLNELRIENKVKYNDYTYTYIPHKLLRISKGKNSVSIWDILGFYKKSLNAAARKYLNKHKREIGSKKFTYENVPEQYEEIRKYCIQDAVLTRDLGYYLLKSLHELKIFPNSLYSVASISFQYFKQHTNIVTVWRFWKECKDILRYATKCYYGGKVEITARGKFYGYEYDINSAYAYEISQLTDISKSKVWKSKKYEKRADYGYLRVFIRDIKEIAHPIVVKIKKMNVYPTGRFNAYITKGEYDFLIRYGIKVDIIDAYWIKCTTEFKPYAHVVKKLQGIKQKYKTSNPFVSHIAKLCNNSFYGKMVQLIEDSEGNLKAGAGWNPLYSSVVTANVRIRISEMQNILKQKCIAVHTDSIISTVELSKRYLGSELGDFEFKKEGSGIMIMSGMYKLGDKNAYRGFRMKRDFDWIKILKEMGNRSKKSLSFIDAKSWIHAIQQNKPDDINRFIESSKILDVNRDTKRVWLENTTGKKLLTQLEQSIQKVIIEPKTSKKEF